MVRPEKKIAASDPAILPGGRLTDRTPAEAIFHAIRRHPFLRNWDAVWNTVRPLYNRLVERLYPRGIEWVINGSDRIRLSASVRGIDENLDGPVWRTLMSRLKPGDTFADIGAHLGLYAIAAASRVAPQGKVIAFEPDAENRRRLQNNVSLNDSGKNIEIVGMAVGDRDTDIAFVAGKDMLSHVSATAEPIGKTVRCTTLDAFFSGRRLDIAKLDVQGFEEAVLRGGSAVLKDPTRGPRLIYIELHRWDWKAIGMETTGDKLIRLLGGYGYALYSAQGKPLTQIDSEPGVFAARPGVLG